MPKAQRDPRAPSSATSLSSPTWRALVGDPTRVKRAMTLVFPRWAAEMLTAQAAAEQRRVDDVLVEIVKRSLSSRRSVGASPSP
jgi:hypothetical protein